MLIDPICSGPVVAFSDNMLRQAFSGWGQGDQGEGSLPSLAQVKPYPKLADASISYVPLCLAELADGFPSPQIFALSARPLTRAADSKHYSCTAEIDYAAVGMIRSSEHDFHDSLYVAIF